MTLFLVSFGLGIAISFICYCIVISIAVLDDLKVKEWFSVEACRQWVAEFEFGFSPGFLLFLGLLLAIFIYCVSVKNIDKKSMNAHGECICSCKACKESSRRLEAIMLHLGLTDENVSQMLPASTNAIGNAKMLATGSH